MPQQSACLETEQVSMFISSNYVLTFQERCGDCFQPVRERIRASRGVIRCAAADHLAYSLLDAVIDSYFPVVDRCADDLDALENEVAEHGMVDVTGRIHSVRNDLLILRRAIPPHRQAVNKLIRDQHPVISGDTRIFLRDCHDHTVQLIDLLEVYRETCADLRDYYLSVVNNRMNEVMKVLTVIATVFLPLSFIAGLYGMNCDTKLPWKMPESRWQFGYGFALGLMLAVAGIQPLLARIQSAIGSAS